MRALLGALALGSALAISPIAFAGPPSSRADIHVFRDGSIYLNGVKVRDEKVLTVRLRALARERPNTWVHFIAEKGVGYDTMARIISDAQSVNGLAHGVVHIGIVGVEGPDSSGPKRLEKKVVIPPP